MQFFRVLDRTLTAAGLDTHLFAFDHNWDHPEYPWTSSTRPPTSSASAAPRSTATAASRSSSGSSARRASGCCSPSAPAPTARTVRRTSPRRSSGRRRTG
ncbi:hypothetical protein NKH77_54730 [Streptomyces sp. M19]